MLRDKAGNRLYRQVTIQVIFPENIFKPKIFRSKAAPKQGFNSEGIADLQMQVADKLDTLYPFWNFRIIELEPVGRTARFVFAFAGYRASQSAPAQVDMKDFTLPNLEDVVVKSRQHGYTAAMEQVGDS